ncbi:hypothetical protein AwWohl_02730 [Gammaproteobacteria bacterium]|nr:hypothetical protein AwWohl_02730 [Gammaproteobacteria bacterium]
MQIFSIKNKELTALKVRPFKLERELQQLFEANLACISNLQLVKSEFTIKEYRIDTLAYDEEAKAFVIIEYKRGLSLSVIDQGVTYLNLMFEYQANFIIEYNELFHKNLKRSDVDWSQSKIIFVAPAFTDYQKQSTNFKDLSIELWEVNRFGDDLLSIIPIKKSKSAPSIKQLKSTNSTVLDTITKNIIVYDESFHLDGKSDELLELYESFKNAILSLAPQLEIKANKLYLAFKQDQNNIVSIHLQNNALKIWLNAKKGNIDDPKQLARDVAAIGHWGVGDYELIVSDTQNKEYIMSLIKQLVEL